MVIQQQGAYHEERQRRIRLVTTASTVTSVHNLSYALSVFCGIFGSSPARPIRRSSQPLRPDSPWMLPTRSLRTKVVPVGVLTSKAASLWRVPATVMKETHGSAKSGSLVFSRVAE
jgi:hypothetical protein